MSDLPPSDEPAGADESAATDGPPAADSTSPAVARARRRRRIKRWLIVSGVLVVVVALALGGTAYYLARKYNARVHRIPDVFVAAPGEHRPPKAKTADKAQNLILVGTDTRATVPTTGSSGDRNAPSSIGSRSDAIMVIHLGASDGSGYVISIPRDSWVDIPGHGKNKINAALAFGGPRLLRRTVEQLTGVHIDHYLEIDFAGFQKMVDAVGGVDIDVPTDSYDSQLRIQWHAGNQHMNGKTALNYARQRYGLPRGDFDRIEHQHAVLKGLMRGAADVGLFQPRSLNRLVSVVSESVSVDDGLSAGALFSLFRKLRGASKNSHFLTVPVRGTDTIDGLSVVVLDTAQDAKLWSLVRIDKMSSYPLPKGS